MNTIIKRTTLLVRSCERSSTFYRDVFGMTVYYDDVIELGGVGLAAGNKGDKTHLMIMRADDPVIGMVGLLEFTEPRLPAPPRRERLGIGDLVFVMQGDDAQGVYRRAIQFGARIHAPPHAYEVRGADGSQLSMTTVSLWDPDDYFIEFNQRHTA
ncbi:MAG: VOC family protein [Proteobacteria bacterium]|mgnify:FL=1|nr:VOC family protein [Pseudomonadota bacterium]